MLFALNLFLVFFSGWIAYGEFNRGNKSTGWLNLLASAINLAAVLYHIL